MAHKKVLMVVAYEGYQPLEYQIPKKRLEHAGFSVITASNKAGTATAKDKSTTNVDITIDKAIAGDYAAIIFVGGPGTLENLDNQISYQLITEAVDMGKLVCAICIAPRILAHASVLNEVAATGWNGDGELSDTYDEYGVIYENAPVVIDQGFITATDPSAATEFADAIVKELGN